MMNKSILKRLRTAAGYQKQAIKALLPDGMDGHLDVIGGELKSMFCEIMAGMTAECREEPGKEEGSKSGSAGNVKKVTID